MSKFTPGLMLGRKKESGVWFAPVSQWRFMWKGHDALYIAAWRLRLRIMR